MISAASYHEIGQTESRNASLIISLPARVADDLNNFLSMNGGEQNERKIMHYKNGREAKIGDQVVNRDNSGNASGGILVQVIPGCTTCNGKILPNKETWNLTSINIGECLHIDDAFSNLAAASDPVPVAT